MRAKHETDPIERRIASAPAPDLTDPDNPEWTAEDFARARPAHEVLPASVLEQFPRTRGPQKAPTKKLVSIRLSDTVLSHFKAAGPGWQSRINDALVAIATGAPEALQELTAAPARPKAPEPVKRVAKRKAQPRGFDPISGKPL